MFFKSILLWTAFTFFHFSGTIAQSISPSAPEPSASSSTKVGWAGTLSSLSGGLQGVVTVIDTNTLVVKGYKLADANAPALYWWGATDTNLKKGFRISNKQ